MTTKDTMGKLVSTTVTGQQEGVALQKLVSHLVAGIVPAAVHRNNFLVNDIPGGLMVQANAERVTAVLTSLFNSILPYVENSCIRITAKVFGNVVLVQLRDHTGINSYFIEQHITEFLPMAEKIGGYIGITSQRDKETTIVFSFLNMRAVA
jgi:hypothetical protein